jgi:hypothetical protein
MRKYFGIAAVVAGTALSAMMALPASAATSSVLTYGSAGGSSVAAGDTLTSSLASGTTATFYSSASTTSGFTCTGSSFTATVTANPAAPGVATESVTGQSFSGCTSNVFGVTGVQSLTLANLPWSASADDSTDSLTIAGTTAAPIEATAVVNTLFGTVTCTYQANNDTVTGALSNTDNSITFSGQQFNLSSGSVLCPGNGFFSAKYAPVVDTTAGGSAVFTN